MAPPGQSLAVNVMHFLRVLRFAGLPIGTGTVTLAVRALASIDVTVREDMYWALHAVCVERHSQSDLFKLAFDRFWTLHPNEVSVVESLEPVVEDGVQRTPDPLPRRLAEALMHAGLATPREHEMTELEFESSETWSAAEHLRAKDFETMSAEELALTKAVIRTLKLPIPDVPNRRFRSHPAGRRIDMRATLRSVVRTGDVINLKHKKRIKRHPPLVVLCDISGSMEFYSRMLLHFLHAVTNDRDRVHTFLFGTRLTNVSHHLAHKDPDVAVTRVADAVSDWSGGTRIGETLGVFNRQWSRRVLGQGAVVLLITDGLDRDGGAGLSKEMIRLQKSCRQLIWLNPLLRFDGFEPKSAGVKTMLPFVDDFRAAHNLDSLAALSDALAQPQTADHNPMTRWTDDMLDKRHA